MSRKKKIFIWLTAPLIIFLSWSFGTFACDYYEDGNHFFSTLCGLNGIRHIKDIRYSGLERDSLDVYYADNHKVNKPVVVYVYGGRWNSGNKTIYKFLGRKFALEGVVTVVPDYTLFPAAKFPASERDIAEAIRWTHEHIKEYGGDPDKIIIIGHSAGAQIGALVAYDPIYLDKAGVPSSVVKGFVGLSGPYDYDPPGIYAESFDGVPSNEWHPIDRVTKAQLPPALLVHGLIDLFIPASNADQFYEKLQQTGAKVELQKYLYVGHYDVLAALTRTASWWMPSQDIDRFIQSF